jgi:hypothetical protein
VKIGTPSVLGRLVMLERSLGTSVGDDPAERARTLAAVRVAQPLVGAHPVAPVPEPARPPDPDAYAVLRTAAAPEELARAADALARAFPSLAGVLRRAAEPDRS